MVVTDSVKVLNVVKGISYPLSEYRNKPNHVLVYKHTGASYYFFEDRSILLKRGQVLFIPKGQSYRVELACDEVSHYTAIQFSAEEIIGEPHIFTVENQAEIENEFVRILHCWSISSKTNAYRVMSLLFGILARLSSILEYDYVPKSKLTDIFPAVQYMKEHIFDPDLRICNLHQLCGISDTYFRKIFRSVYKTSPQQYVTSCRMRQAKHILEEHTCASVAEAAMMVGYQDPLYFSRVFKKCFDISPSELLK